MSRASVLTGILVYATMFACDSAQGQAPTEGVLSPSHSYMLRLSDSHRELELQAIVDGQTYSSYWENLVSDWFSFADRNGDELIDSTELPLLPSAREIKMAMNIGYVTPLAPLGEKESLGVELPITCSQLADHYRRAGLGRPMVVKSRLSHSTLLEASLLAELDWNDDGEIGLDELAHADQRLAKLDTNGDELIGAGELVPRLVYPGIVAREVIELEELDPRERENAEAPMPSDSQDSERLQWTIEVVTAESSNSSAGRSWAELSARSFKLLRDDGIRVEGWSVEGLSHAKLQRLIEAIESRHEASSEAEQSSDSEDVTDDPWAWLAGCADRDANGTVDEYELSRWLDLQQRLLKTQVLIELHAEGGLFEIVDSNHDAALSIRELRAMSTLVGGAGGQFVLRHAESSEFNTSLIIASLGTVATFAQQLEKAPEWFEAMDRNSDGDVSLREFSAELETFEQLDVDHDGLLSVQEAAQVLNK